MECSFLAEHYFATLIFSRYLSSDDARANPDPEVVHALNLASLSAISVLKSGLFTAAASHPSEVPQPHIPLGIMPQTMAQRPFPSESPHSSDIEFAMRYSRSDMHSLSPACEGSAAGQAQRENLHESATLLGNQQRHIDPDNTFGLDMPHWGAEIIDSAWNCDTHSRSLHDPAAAAPLSGLYYGVVADASAPLQGGQLPMRKRHLSSRESELGGMIDQPISDLDDDDGITNNDAQLALGTSMAELRIKELTEKVSLIAEVRNDS